VFLEERTRGRFRDDVLELDVDPGLLQKTSGVAAGRSGGLAVEQRLGHWMIIAGRGGRDPRLAVTVDYNTEEC
jgi:hypothetical protein